VTGPRLVVVADAAAAAALAADRIASQLRDAVTTRGRADGATTGGSTAPAIYRRLSVQPLAGEVPWDQVHVWWGDDRYVPRDHPESNVKPLDDILLGVGQGEGGTAGTHVGVALPAGNLHPFPIATAIGEDRGAAWAAASLADELRGAGLAGEDGWPVFDLVILGIGHDGHALSVFPGSAALDSDDLALAIPAPTHIEPHLERVTLNPAVVGVAREVLVIIHGADKAEILATVLGPTRDPVRWPAQLAARPGATWIVDEAAASALPD
jgi:6-phosphogluconolactonase